MKHVTFYSTSFCPTCKFLKPKVQEAYPDTEFVLLDDKQELADSLGIQSVPTIIFWEEEHKDYNPMELIRLSGGITIQQFKETLVKVGLA